MISADGKKPRVKSNIQAGQSLVGKSPTKPKKKQGSKKVELDRSQLGNINFVEPRPQDHETTEDPFAGKEDGDIQDKKSCGGNLRTNKGKQ